MCVECVCVLRVCVCGRAYCPPPPASTQHNRHHHSLHLSSPSLFNPVQGTAPLEARQISNLFRPFIRYLLFCSRLLLCNPVADALPEFELNFPGLPFSNILGLVLPLLGLVSASPRPLSPFLAGKRPVVDILVATSKRLNPVPIQYTTIYDRYDIHHHQHLASPPG